MATFELYPLLQDMLDHRYLVEIPGDGTRRALRYVHPPKYGDPVLWVTPNGHTVFDGTGQTWNRERLQVIRGPLYTVVDGTGQVLIDTPDWEVALYVLKNGVAS